MGWIKAIFNLISGYFGFVHDKTIEDGVKAQDKALTEEQVLEAIKDEQITDSKPLSDDLLVSPDNRGHNND